MQKNDDSVTTTDISSVDPEKATIPTSKALKWLKDTRPLNDVVPGSPPDGGWQAWRQVLGGFLVITLCWGFINSFGLFQLYYSSTLIPDTSPSSISWIGPIQLFLLMFIGAYSGSAADAGYFRTTYIAGASFFVLGVFLTGFCTRYWQLVLTHGVCNGVGNGLVFIPTVSVASTYFSARRRSIAIGLMFCGSAVGGMILPAIFSRLLPKIGFGWTMRVFAFIALGVFAIALTMVQKRLPPKDEVRILSVEALQDRAFVIYVIGSFANFLGIFFAFFYLPSFAKSELGLDLASATNLLLVINGVAIPGRLIPSWLADQRQWSGVNPLTVQLPINLASSIMLFAWVAVKTEASAYVFAALYGLAASGLQVLFPASLAEMTKDPRKSGAQLGWGFTICSFACLLGNPIGGLILQAANNHYTYAQIYGAICISVGFVIVTAAAWTRHRC